MLSFARANRESPIVRCSAMFFGQKRGCALSRPFGARVYESRGRRLCLTAQFVARVKICDHKRRATFLRFCSVNKIDTANYMTQPNWTLHLMLAGGLVTSYGPAGTLYRQFFNTFHSKFSEDFDRLARENGFASGLEALSSIEGVVVNGQHIRMGRTEENANIVDFIAASKPKAYVR